MVLKKILRKIKAILKLNEDCVSYSGNYKSFDECEQIVQSIGGGYDADSIFEKVKSSTLAVKDGKAVFERDSFLFYKKEINYNLMMYFYKIYIEDKKINVLDFGGAMGSTFFQHKRELEDINTNWTVIEQNHFVKFGKQNLENDNLRFSYESELCNCWSNFNVVLFSSVLQYIKNYESIIDSYCSKKIKNIIIERTPVSDHKRFWIETVHEPIYEAVYPCMVFEETDFINRFIENGYELIDSWNSLVDCDVFIDKKTVQFKSFVFRLKD